MLAPQAPEVLDALALTHALQVDHHGKGAGVHDDVDEHVEPDGLGASLEVAGQDAQ